MPISEEGRGGKKTIMEKLLRYEEANKENNKESFKEIREISEGISKYS